MGWPDKIRKKLSVWTPWIFRLLGYGFALFLASMAFDKYNKGHLLHAWIVFHMCICVLVVLISIDYLYSKSSSSLSSTVDTVIVVSIIGLGAAFVLPTSLAIILNSQTDADGDKLKHINQKNLRSEPNKSSTNFDESIDAIANTLTQHEKLLSKIKKTGKKTQLLMNEAAQNIETMRCELGNAQVHLQQSNQMKAKIQQEKDAGLTDANARSQDISLVEMAKLFITLTLATIFGGLLANGIFEKKKLDATSSGKTDSFRARKLKLPRRSNR